MGHRVNNVYMISLDDISSNDAQCFITREEESWLWHKRIAQIHMDHLNKLISKELVIGLPKICFEKDKLCDACQKGKQAKVSFQSKNDVSTPRLFQLLHIDLFGPSRTMSFGGNCDHDFSRNTWTLFWSHKSQVFSAFKILAKVIQNQKDLKIACIRNDHGGNLQIMILKNFVTNTALSIISRLQGPHNTIVLWRGKIAHLFIWLEQCSMIWISQSTFGPMPLASHVMS
jgi:hypothetical protein